MTGDVLAELRTFPRFGSEIQFDVFFNRIWASFSSVVAQIDISLIVMYKFNRNIMGLSN